RCGSADGVIVAFDFQAQADVPLRDCAADVGANEVALDNIASLVGRTNSNVEVVNRQSLHGNVAAEKAQSRCGGRADAVQFNAQNRVVAVAILMPLRKWTDSKRVLGRGLWRRLPLTVIALTVAVNEYRSGDQREGRQRGDRPPTMRSDLRVDRSAG